MKEEKIQELLSGIFSVKYKWRVDNSSSYHESFIISEDRRNVIEGIVRNWINDNHDSKQGELEAKVYAYEQMISKSTFAPFLKVEEKAEIKKEPFEREMLFTEAQIRQLHGRVNDITKDKEVDKLFNILLGNSDL